MDPGVLGAAGWGVSAKRYESSLARRGASAPGVRPHLDRPDTMILTCFQRPLQACVSNFAPPADLLGLFNLEEGRASVPNREEQLRILIQTGGSMAPIHGVPTPNFAIPKPQ